MHLNRIALSCLLALGGQSAAAADKIPAETFARHVQYSGATLSPTGEYVAVSTPYEDRRALSIMKLSGNYDTVQIKFDNFRETIFGASWTDDYRVILSKGVDNGTLESPSYYGDIWGSDADGKNQAQLWGYVKDRGNIRARTKDEGWAYFMRRLNGTQGEALFSFVPWPTSNSESRVTIYRMNTHTGERKQIEVLAQGGSATADRNGVVRFNATEDINGEPILRYRPNASDAWTAVPKSLAGRSMFVSYFEADNNHAIAGISDKGEPAAIYRVDFSKGTRERIAGNETMEVGNWEFSGFEGPLFAVVYTAGKPKIDYIDPTSEFAKLHAGLMKLFPGQIVEFVNFTKDSNKVLFFVSSDRHPGAYYVFDRTTKTPTMLFETMEWIDPAKMSPTRSIEFKNRNGDSLYGFYTAPLGKQGKLPLVVMPHGGPFGVSDAWGYDADVQFLASRGYAVLQVNFRGSGERGENFERSTYRQWGEGIQDDIADGVRWTIDQGLTDPGKVCIYGASFGGYSALMNPIRNPGMYKCAIGYAGVYDLEEMYKSGDIEDSKQGRSFLARAVGTDPAAMAKQSPVHRIAELDVPVLLIHGKADRRAPINQYNMLESALKKSGKPYETLVKSDEGHGFYSVANQTEAYERMEAFLRKYNPAD